MDLPVMPPIRPMLAKPAAGLPAAIAEKHSVSFEPKWDGFRCIIFRDGDVVELGSRNERPLTRYFPELVAALPAVLPDRCVIDGELVIIAGDRLDFDGLQQRIHPAASRIEKLSLETPASFMAFDLLALGDTDLRGQPFSARRAELERALTGVTPPVYLTPATTDPVIANQWFVDFEGAGLDGLIAKPLDGVYEENKRAQFKLKHVRSADVVVAGFRWHKDGNGIGSLLLGVFDDDQVLHHVGVASSFSVKRRTELIDELSPLRQDALIDHPWADWMDQDAHLEGRKPGALSRWSGTKDHRWEPLRPERVAEVKYGSTLNGRFREVTSLLRWRPDKSPESCRFDQLDEPAPLGIDAVLDPFSGTD